MPGHTRSTRPPDSSTGTDSGSTAGAAPSVWDRLGNAYQNLLTSEENKEDVVLYMSLNSTTHHQTEIPEAMTALAQAEKDGLGHRELLPISDPYNLGKKNQHDTYDHSLGKANADKLTFWHDDEEMKEGEVRIGEGEPIMLGTENIDPSTEKGKKELLDIQTNWDKVLAEMGMDDEYRAKTVEALLGDGVDPKKLGSGDGATNELLQYTMAMYRAEKGEYNVKSIVLSGHHWNAGRDDVYSEGGADSGKGIWGEQDHHQYDAFSDDRSRPGGDFFSFEDIGALGSAFPKAYSQVESVQMAACNTHNLGMTDDAGNKLSTDEWLQGTFGNIERASYWEGFAPTAANGAYSNGEFVLDDMRADQGKGDWKDVISKRNGKNIMARSELDADGKLARIDDADLKTSSKSYIPGKGKNARGENANYWDQKKSRREHVYTAGDGEIGSSPEREAYDAALADAFSELNLFDLF